MSEPVYPVTVAVRQPDGSIAQVRVGTATRSGDGFRLTLGELSIGASAEAPAPVRRSGPVGVASGGGGWGAGGGGGGGGGDGMVFPPYGRSKGAPIAGASMGDLEFYANGCRRTLNDPAKSRWHDKERQLLAAIEAEIARQGGGLPTGASAGAPELSWGGGGSGGFGGGGGGRSSGRAFDDGPPPRVEDDRPPPSDDDIPF